MPFECPSAQVPEYPSAQVPWVPFECPSASTPRVPDCLECPSVLRVPLECPLSWVPLERPSSTQVPFECPSSILWVSKCSLNAFRVKNTGNGLLNSFIEFFKNFLTLIVLCFLGIKMRKFYHVLITRYKSFKGVLKTFLDYFAKFQKN